MDRTEVTIGIAHKLVGMTGQDDQELINLLKIMTNGFEFSGQELLDIVAFAATVAKAQHEQLQVLLVTRQ